MKNLTSKERVRIAFAHEEPDRVPIDYSANPGIDRKLKKHFGLGSDDHEGLLQALQVDFRDVTPRYAGPALHRRVPDRIINEWGAHMRWVEHESGGYWDFCDWPLQDATLREIQEWPMPSPDDYDYDDALARLRSYPDHYLTLGNPGIGDVINSTGMVRTMEQVLVDMISDGPETREYARRKSEIELEVMGRMLDRARGAVDMLWIGEDLGTQKGALIGIDLFRKVLRPHHQQFVDLARSFDIPVMIHSCGSSSWAFDDFIEMGISAVDTLQPEAADMDPGFLKARYGDRLSFHGMISTAGPVAFGSVEEVRTSVRQILETMKPGGGYACCPTHALQDNSPLENVLVMYEEAQTTGVY